MTRHYITVETNIAPATKGFTAFMRDIRITIRMNASPTLVFANTARDLPVEYPNTVQNTGFTKPINTVVAESPSTDWRR